MRRLILQISLGSIVVLAAALLAGCKDQNTAAPASKDEINARLKDMPPSPDEKNLDLAPTGGPKGAKGI